MGISTPSSTVENFPISMSSSRRTSSTSSLMITKRLWVWPSRPSADFQTDADQKAPPRVVRAKQQVVLSAGALGTPQILERSGVGNRDILSRAGIPLVASVPGVGEN